MSRLSQQVKELQQARNAAREGLDIRLAHVREDLQARGVGSRIVHRLGRETRDACEQALDVAKQSKGVVAGTVGALLAWTLRRRIAEFVARLLSSGRDEGEQVEEDLTDE